MINSDSSAVARRLLRGAGEGVIATAIMTGVFAAFRAAGWLGQLPPRQVVDRILPALGDRPAAVITMIAHFGYGAGLGATYRLLSRSPSVIGGSAYGISVCVANYEGGLPLFRIREPMHSDSAREITALAGGHLAYGAVLGGLAGRGK